jgi:hypothetical protein
VKVFAIFKDGTKKEIDKDSAGIRDSASPAEAISLARKELTILEEKQLATWEVEEDFLP